MCMYSVSCSFWKGTNHGCVNYIKTTKIDEYNANIVHLFTTTIQPATLIKIHSPYLMVLHDDKHRFYPLWNIQAVTLGSSRPLSLTVAPWALGRRSRSDPSQPPCIWPLLALITTSNVLCITNACFCWQRPRVAVFCRWRMTVRGVFACFCRGLVVGSVFSWLKCSYGCVFDMLGEKWNQDSQRLDT